MTRPSSADINDYLRSFSDGQFTAKDYRTWAASVLALRILKTQPFATEQQAKSNIVATIREVAAVLGNTPTVCRRCYVHPDVLQAYLQNALPQLRERAAKPAKPGSTGLDGAEAGLLAFLKKTKKKTGMRVAKQA